MVSVSVFCAADAGTQKTKDSKPKNAKIKDINLIEYLLLQTTVFPPSSLLRYNSTYSESIFQFTVLFYFLIVSDVS